MSLVELPPELWSLVFEELDQSSLSVLSRSSKEFAALARPNLFRSIVLRSHGGVCCTGYKTLKESSQDVMRLLVSDPTLAKRVTSMELNTARVCSHHAATLSQPWINFKIFPAMLNLRRLRLFGLVFESDGDRRLLMENLPALKVLEFRGRCSDVEEDFAISGLEKITWMTEELDWKRSTLLSAYSAVEASCATITHLTLPAFWNVNVYVAGVREHILTPPPPFLALRFPKLRAFSVFYPDAPEKPVVAPPEVTEFLHAHPQIEDLSLRWPTDSFEENATFVDENVTLGTGFLPNLRSFVGDTRNLVIMASEGVKSLQTLTRLHTGIWVEDGGTESDEINEETLVELQSYGGFLSVTELKLESTPVSSPLDTIKEWASLCPAARCIITTEHVNIPLDPPAGQYTTDFSEFALFPELVQLEFSDQRKPGMINTIFEKVPTLKSIVLDRAWDDDGKYIPNSCTRWDVVRNIDGTLSSVIAIPCVAALRVLSATIISNSVSVLGFQQNPMSISWDNNVSNHTQTQPAGEADGIDSPMISLPILNYCVSLRR